jgi:hypothetical protein
MITNMLVSTLLTYWRMAYKYRIKIHRKMITNIRGWLKNIK